jgi:hypothetical protein
MTRKGYITIALLVFIASLIAQAPAATLYAWFKPKAPAPVELIGLQGTINTGRASGLNVNNRSTLNNLNWKLQPWRLLLGQLGFHLESHGDTTLDSHIALSIFGSTGINDTQGVMNLKTLLTAIGQPFLPLDGQARLQLKSLRLRSNQFKSADGRIEIRGLAWTLAQEPIVLGDFAAVVTTENDTIIAQFQPLAGTLELNGTAKLSPDQSYEAQLQLRPKPGAPPLLNSLLGSIGPADPQGWYHIRQQGKLQ